MIGSAGFMGTVVVVPAAGRWSGGSSRYGGVPQVESMKSQDYPKGILEE